MSLDESRYTALADETLEHLADTIDDLLGDKIDVDLESGILTLSLDGGGQYVINKHTPNREIWMSSPVSGALHFAPAEDGQWISTRPPHGSLLPMLAGELSAKFGVAMSF